MRRRLAMMTAAAVIGSAFLTSTGAAAGTHPPARAGAKAARAVAPRVAAGTITWGTAAEIPGSQALNKAGMANIGAISCPTSGACGAGGSYTNGFNGRTPIVQAFVVNKTASKWRKAIEVPGLQALNTAGRAKVNAVSCTSNGNCTAGGYYGDGTDHSQAFVVDQVSGTWGTAQEVPGTAALDKGSPGAAVASVSCASPGNCAAGGFYSDSAGNQQAFVVSETNGTWGTAVEVPGSGSLNAGGFAQIQSVSCTSPGNCSAGGYYSSSSTDGIPTVQAMLVNETSGTWGTAEEVPGTSSLNGGGYAQINSVSCDAPGDCAAGGEYTNSTPATQAFVVNETGGTWGTAQEVPGTQTLNVRKLAQVNSVSCPSSGNCTAGGFYQDSSFNNQAFVVNETGGTWGTAQEVPGTASLDQAAPGATVVAVSCASAGNCSAGGMYTDSSSFQQAWVGSETNGTWGTAEEVPGYAALNVSGLGTTQAVACAPAGLCSAGGTYENANGNTQVFAVNQTKS
jgi:hypothetical protein